jgi:hypothetical protein
VRLIVGVPMTTRGGKWISRIPYFAISEFVEVKTVRADWLSLVSGRLASG